MCSNLFVFLLAATQVTVHISDINDHPPMFVHDGYSFTISEDSGAGTFIGALEVTDKDLGQNAEVFYKIVSDGIFHYINIFSLYTHSLNYYQARSYL